MEKRDTTGVGNRAVGMVLAALLKAGYPVLLPFGEGHRYDLAYDDNGTILRVQGKSGVFRNGGVYFRTASSTGRIYRSYRGDADVFGVYCEELDKVYLVPVAVVGEVTAVLRVTPSRNGQKGRVRWADAYEIRRHPELTPTLQLDDAEVAQR